MATTALSGAADEGNLDDGFYYIITGARWVVEPLPKNPKNVKSITVVKDDGSTHTITSLDMGDYAIICHEQKRTCRELRPQMMTPVE